MQQQNAYLSEWGNNTLDFSKQTPSGLHATTHFIVSAIIPPNVGAPEVLPILEAVSRRHFDGGRIDSDAVGSDHNRRQEILEDLDEMDFRIFALILDKRQLSGHGLRFKGSLFKFMHGLVDRELFDIYPDLEMITS
ncbi:MAG TPA: hypothetical protein VKB19_02495, partial [Pedobacter sp.]|nr:hypothetical protein [Pedobacter sp.]